ncbi:hypothetical protein [Leptolyngbya sp. GGD]|uniref:hypothetical protein n=1 Tax=Leptolyngbya sp. GGD TaxID=2997907 RepID=UPI00227CD194|nr:hypothetical protein [Leptolyngbya sp. GGD]MCY6491246.1 hypothetical protein [Leptolyngbya sp. GGD]
MMKLLQKFFSTIVLSLILFVGFSNIPAHAAITPGEAKGVIRDSGSMMEAAEKLREADSTAEVRQQYKFDGENKIHTAQDPIAKTQDKLKGAVENVKEKLNLDEPLPPSTKKFLGKREEIGESNGKTLVREDPGSYQRNRQTQVFTEEK